MGTLAEFIFKPLKSKEETKIFKDIAKLQKIKDAKFNLIRFSKSEKSAITLCFADRLAGDTPG